MARIAYEKVRQESPDVLARAEALLRVYSGRCPRATIKEKEFPLVECATFADDIKYKGGGWQSAWHFIDQPWFADGGNASDFPDFEANPRNLTFVLP